MKVIQKQEPIIKHQVRNHHSTTSSHLYGGSHSLLPFSITSSAKPSTSHPSAALTLFSYYHFTNSHPSAACYPGTSTTVAPSSLLEGFGYLFEFHLSLLRLVVLLACTRVVTLIPSRLASEITMESNVSPCKLSDYTSGKGGQRFSHYVVWNGRRPGIYSSWNDCSKQVMGFKNATFKGYYDLESAITAFKGDDEGPLSSGGAMRDTSSGMCPNCEYLSLKIKLLETELAYYKEKLQNSPSRSSSNEKSVPMLIEELGEILKNKAVMSCQ